jgi:hypothetical protein
MLLKEVNDTGEETMILVTIHKIADILNNKDKGCQLHSKHRSLQALIRASICFSEALAGPSKGAATRASSDNKICHELPSTPRVREEIAAVLSRGVTGLQQPKS